MIRINNKRKGFTLIELLVALVVFSIVILAVVSIFLMAFRGQRKILAAQRTQENARYILETVAKEIRMAILLGKTSALGPLLISEKTPSPSFRVLHIPNGAIEYEFSNGNLIRRNFTAGKEAILNSSQVEVTGNFYLLGDGVKEQSRVTIFMQAKSRGQKPEQQSEIILQTTVSRRTLLTLELP